MSSTQSPLWQHILGCAGRLESGVSGVAVSRVASVNRVGAEVDWPCSDEEEGGAPAYLTKHYSRLHLEDTCVHDAS